MGIANLFDDNGAEFSADKKYRYALWRIWNSEKPLVMFIGLNPSKATENANDNTITKVIKVARNNGFGGLYMMNLFAYITPHPEELKKCKDPLGDNDGWLEKVAPKCKRIVFAWGNFKEAKERSEQVVKMFDSPHCFVQNKNGSPKHPLYCLDETVFIPFKKPQTKK